MAIRIRFDTDNVPEKPTLVLGKRNGDKIGQIPNIDNIKLKDCLNNTPEFSFTVHKYDNGKLCEYWDDIKDLRSPCEKVELKNVILPKIKFETKILQDLLSEMKTLTVSPGIKG